MADMRYILAVAKIKLSDYVRQVASRKGLSASDVSKRARRKISQNYLNDIVNEKTTNPTVKNLQALALGLGVPEEDLFRVARGLSLNPVENPIEVELIQKFHRLPTKRQQELLRLIDFYDVIDDTEINETEAMLVPPKRKITK